MQPMSDEMIEVDDDDAAAENYFTNYGRTNAPLIYINNESNTRYHINSKD